ncbi:MAG: DUF4118 domain-containing protein [Candidatus Schekmanbacteria bacterium]|nr:DUF4118 domain-containing protein [Candidatus Schekmanbacteria bacterium]
MVEIFLRRFENVSTRNIICIGLCSVIVLGAVDYFTGFELSFSIFYLIPVTFVSWFSGFRYGVLTAFVSAATWLWADLYSGHRFSVAIIPFWNSLVRFFFFFVVASLLSRLKYLYSCQVVISRELRESLDSVKTLSGLIPICAWCKRVRTDEGYWQQVEAYVSERTDASFSHGICMECREKELSTLGTAAHGAR